jgi:serine/threonine protein kinase
MPQLSTGLQIGKTFKITGFIKSTHWGEKYLAIHISSSRVVEVHLLNKLIKESAEGVSSIIETVNGFKGVIHKNIVESFGGGYLDPEKKAPYIVSSHIEGDTLREYISKKYPLGAPVAACRLILFHLVKLLGDINGNFYHGSLNPDNVIISKVGRIMVSNFNIVTSAQNYLSLEQLIESENNPFMAPELFDGSTSIFSDIYGVGVLANYLTSGKTLKEDNSPNLKQNSSPLLVTTITKAISIDPEQRYETPELLHEQLMESLKDRKKGNASVIMVDLLETFQDDDDEDKKFMVQKGRLDYGPYSSTEIRTKAIDELIDPEHIIVNIDSGFRKKLEKHPDFIDFMGEYLRRMELKRREKAEVVVAVKEKQQSRTFKLAIALGVVGIIAIVASMLLYKTVVDSSTKKRRKLFDSGEAEFEVAVKGKGGAKSKKRRRKRRRRRRGGKRRRKRGSKGGGGGSAGDEIKVYALDNVQLTRTQINSIVKPAIGSIAKSCIPSSGRIYISYQVNGRRGKVAYASAKLNGKKDKKISRCAYRILKKLKFPKLNTDISGFGGISF